MTVADPYDPAETADVAAARRLDGFFNRVFLDPILTGRYADDLHTDTEGRTFQGRPWQDWVRDGDLEVINQPLDVLGVNYYHGDGASGRDHDQVLGADVVHPERPTSPPYPDGRAITFPDRGLPTTDMGWEVQPEALTRLLVRLRDTYDVPPLYVTENGAAYDDLVTADGAVHDEERRAYLESHVRAIHAAIERGVDVRGYFAWSLLDNFEWAYGYRQRFGIVHVDYETLRRTPKDSALWYARLATSGRLPVDDGGGTA
jgi:beta-glucosidase